MKGVAFPGDRRIQFLDVADPVPGPGEVVIEIKASGMCGTDLGFYRAARGAERTGFAGIRRSGPVIAGHEPCGVVAAIGPGVGEREARLGQRVMCHHYLGCGVCDHCRTGWSQLCPESPVIYGNSGHGAHAPYMKVAARTLVPLPEALSFTTGAAISCGTGTAFAALQRMGASGRDTVAIFGQGPVGLAATQLAVAMGARVIALDINAERLARAKTFGADAAIDTGKQDSVAAIKELTQGRGADLTLETSGAPSARVEAVRGTKCWGTACYVGMGGTVTLDVGNDMVRRQLTLIASWTFSSVGQADCARFIAQHAVAADDIFTNRWRLDQAEEAYALSDRQQGGKGVFVM